MLGVNSENLRLHVTAADYIQKEINVSIGNVISFFFFQQILSTYIYIFLNYRKFIGECNTQK